MCCCTHCAITRLHIVSADNRTMAQKEVERADTGPSSLSPLSLLFLYYIIIAQYYIIAKLKTAAACENFLF